MNKKRLFIILKDEVWEKMSAYGRLVPINTTRWWGLSSWSSLHEQQSLDPLLHVNCLLSILIIILEPNIEKKKRKQWRKRWYEENKKDKNKEEEDISKKKRVTPCREIMHYQRNKYSLTFFVFFLTQLYYQ